jgi:rhamnose transport system permease protein
MSDVTIRPDEPHLSTAEVERLVEPSRQPRTMRWFNTIVRSREMSIFLVLVLVIAAATIKTPSFLFSANSWRDLLLTPSILLLLAAGQAVVIITRNVDLSVGSVLALTAYLTGRRASRSSWCSSPASPSVRCSAWSTACWWGSRRCRRW